MRVSPFWWLVIAALAIWGITFGTLYLAYGQEGFASATTCYVLGYVYAMPGEAATFQRADSCEGVRHDVSQGMLVLHSPREWVAIVLPGNGGNQRFTYRWGSPSALIDGHAWPVAYGPVGKG